MYLPSEQASKHEISFSLGFPVFNLSKVAQQKLQRSSLHTCACFPLNLASQYP